MTGRNWTRGNRWIVSPRFPRGFSKLAVFDARLYIRVRCIDEVA